MKKLSLLLASIGAGLLLVGGTVAAYIVTAADTLGVRVSPGSIEADKNGRVTLSWATNTTHPVGNLVPGQETEVGQVKLAAASDEQGFTTYTGKFTVTFTNMSADNEFDLMNYLTIKVYKDTTGAGTAYGEAETLPNATKVGDYMQTSKTDSVAVSGYIYKVTVTLNANAGEEYYSSLLQQTAYATFDWGPKTGDIDERNLSTVYFAVDSLAEGHELYAHIYKGNAVAADYPGLKMTYVYDIEGGKQLYSASFDREKYDSFKFIDVKTTAPTSTTVIASVTKAFAATEASPYYKVKTTEPEVTYEWAGKPNEALAKYYVRGSIGGENYWSVNNKALALQANTSVEGEYLITDLVLHNGDEIKIYEPNGDHWYGPSEGNYVITSDGKYTVCFKYGHADETGETGSWVNGMGVFKQAA